MEIVRGVIPSVLSKLGGLLVSEYNLQKELKGEIRFLEVELESMQGALDKVSGTPADQVDNQDKIWASAVRELSYDIEDTIDTFMVHDKGRELAGLHGLKKCIEKSMNLLTQLRVRHKIATEVRGMKRRVIEVAEQRLRYKIDNDLAKPVTFDTRILPRYKKATELVGIDEERDAVVKILMEGNEVSKGNIVSIVGFGGLGKTTLATMVYEKLKGHFDCSAFVSVSQTPDMDKLFMDMARQLATHASNNAIREFLLTKRYIIVIDDIWNIPIWDMIRYALPDNNCGYRIITTTRISNVAEQAGGAYKMKPLSLHNSKTLLYRKIFGIENKWNNEDTRKCPDEELAEVLDRILKKCAGVPLAIITIASLLASKGRDKLEWYEVCNSIGTGLEDGQDVDNMRNILSFSYYSMPFHLRTCFLYLSVFPEDHKISKDHLIRMWIAEGFIQCRKQGDSLLELGESCFNELVNRSMIQPVCEEYNDLVVDHFRVHDMMLDLIHSISEEDFVTILNDVHHISPPRSRRLSIQSNKVDPAMLGDNMSLLQVRSLIVFHNNINVIPSLPRFRVLRVLELWCYEISQDCSLKFLGHLLHLRYLGLNLYSISTLPEEMGNLRFLQTLDIERHSIEYVTLPSIIVCQLRNLKCLRTGFCPADVPKGIGNLTALEELSVGFEEGSGIDIMEELGLLTELRVLSMKFYLLSVWNDVWQKSLTQCLCKLRKLRSLFFSCFSGHDSVYLNLDSWVTPRHLCRFDMDLRRPGISLSKLPSWMGSTLLVDLSVVCIRMKELHQEDLEILGRLPALRILHLDVDGDHIIWGFTFAAGSFPCLVHYVVRRKPLNAAVINYQKGIAVVFNYQKENAVVFEKGAMPRLAVLDFIFPVWETKLIFAGGDGGFDLGLGNLPSLQHVCVYLETEGDSKEEVMEVKAALMHSAEIHPNHPTLEIHDGDLGEGIRAWNRKYG